MDIILANKETNITKASLNLDQLDNTSDENKPISIATQSALDTLQTQIDDKVSLSGGTMTGNLMLNADPTIDLQIATKQYVDNYITEITSFEWGDETAIGDADWWAGLKKWIGLTSASERAKCVGKKKLVSLSTAVLGANAATMLCIGADQDGDKTLAFQTAGVLPTIVYFDMSSADWSIASVRYSQCQNFYSYCSAKDSIKTVSKGTCLKYNDSRNGTVTYNDETAWLPSEREMGLDSYSPISVANSTTTNAECTYGYNAAYSYYSNNSSRVKYKMSADGTVGTTACYYWERSRDGHGYSWRVCRVNPSGAANFGNYSSETNMYLAPAFVIG